MSLAKPSPTQSRKPEVEELPDGRFRYTRFLEKTNAGQITQALFDQLAIGDLDPQQLFAGARLIKESASLGADSAGKSYLIREFEQIPETAEIQVGENTVIKLEDGRTAIEAEFLQFSAATATPGTVGTTTAPGDAAAFLQREEATDDGALRRIKRTYVYEGLLSQVDETRNNGALLLRTVVWVKTEPVTPGGYTLVTSKRDPVNGLPVYTYTFAKGEGEISRGIDYGQSSDQGTTGVTRTTIRHLTTASVSADPTTLVGSVKIGEEKSEQDGYRVWTITYAKGSGTVSTSNDTRNNGGLLLRTIVALGAAPSTPAGYTAVSTQAREDAGYVVYTYQFAKGDGEISRTVDYAQSSDQGTTGVTRTTIRHLTAASVNADPTSLGGSVKVGEDKSEQDGYRVWTITYAKGAGTVSTLDDTRNGGGLLLRTIVALGSAPSTPSGYTVVSTQSREDAGFVVYTYGFAKGNGEISRSVDYGQSSDQGTTGITRTTIRHLTAASVSADPTTLVGSVKIAEDKTDQDGHRVWTILYAKGTGLVGQSIQARQDGLREVTNVSLGTRIAPDGIVRVDDYRLADGYTIYTVSAMQTAAGGADPEDATLSFETYRDFLYPGRAKAFQTGIGIGGAGLALDVFLSPPVHAQVKATVTVTYQTASTLGTISNYWNPTDWATMRGDWIDTSNLPCYELRALHGYRAVSGSAITVTTGGANPYTGGTVMGNRILGTGGVFAVKVQVSGGPAAPDGNTYTLDASLEPAFTATDGTQYYRKTIVTATIPAQAALPV